MYHQLKSEVNKGNKEGLMTFKTNLLIADNDLDGSGAVVVAEVAFSEVQTLMPDRPEQESTLKSYLHQYLEEGNTSTNIWIVDWAPKEEETLELIECYLSKGGKVKLFDHHKTALGLNNYEWATVQVETNGHKHCGSELFWSYLKSEGFVNPGLDFLIEQIRLYDTWDWTRLNKPLPRKLNDLFEYDSTTFLKNRIKDCDQGLFNLTSSEEHLIEFIEASNRRYIEDKLKSVVELERDGYLVGLVFAEQLASQLGNEVCNQYEHLDYALILNLSEKKASLRTNKSAVDVSVIAKNNGGGGHVMASGYPLSESLIKDFVQHI